MKPNFVKFISLEVNHLKSVAREMFETFTNNHKKKEYELNCPTATKKHLRPLSPKGNMLRG